MLKKLTVANHPLVDFLLPIGWMLLIFTASSIPSEQMPKAGAFDLLVKKASHMAAYAVLAFLWSRPLSSKPITPWIVFAIAVIYAVTDEFHQTFVSGRNGNGVDVMVDAIGALAGLGLWHLLTRESVSNKEI